ncbi:hypothetical protein CHS0354_002351 [Potamilus streckersoni]|uniref:Uncharacterized protein n=1 Tax=Potamilus streckersoni TaxID=2493646 RepID=A0AAE0SNN9_9BIVA|nr:hypothetical protein CHS0354_002351 [Potamilus streckersoni]
MSATGSPQQRVAGREIPVRRIADLSHLPSDYSTTPGGSIFSTTPGGSRIYYDRSFLLQCRNSPLTKSPPPNMAKIPGVTVPEGSETKEKSVVEEKKPNPPADPDDQFQMEI